MKNVRLKAIISILEHLQDLLGYVSDCGTDEYYGYEVDNFFLVLHSYNDIWLISTAEMFNIMDFIYSLDYSGAVAYLRSMGVSNNA